MSAALDGVGVALLRGVVITGASTGIGRARALTLDSLGFRVFAGVCSDRDVAALRLAGSERLTPVRLDVTDPDFIAAAAETITREVGGAGLAGLVNNAGVAIPDPLEYLDLDTARRHLETNRVGQMAVTQAFLPLGRRRISSS